MTNGIKSIKIIKGRILKKSLTRGLYKAYFGENINGVLPSQILDRKFIVAVDGVQTSPGMFALLYLVHCDIVSVLGYISPETKIFTIYALKIEVNTHGRDILDKSIVAAIKNTIQVDCEIRLKRISEMA